MEDDHSSFLVIEEGGTRVYSFPRIKEEEVAFSSLISAISALGSDYLGEKSKRKKVEYKEKKLLLLETEQILFVLILPTNQQEEKGWQLLERLSERFTEEFGTSPGWLTTHIDELRQFDKIAEKEFETRRAKNETEEQERIREFEHEETRFEGGMIEQRLKGTFEPAIPVPILKKKIKNIFEGVKVYTNWNTQKDYFEGLLSTDQRVNFLDPNYKKISIYLYGKRSNSNIKNLKISIRFHGTKKEDLGGKGENYGKTIEEKLVKEFQHPTTLSS